MALPNKKRIAAGSTSFPALEKKAPGDAESGAKVKNHFEASDLLVDPQEALEGGSTHTPVTASADLDEDLAIDSLEEVDSMYEEGEEGDADDSETDPGESAEVEFGDDDGDPEDDLDLDGDDDDAVASILDDADDAATDEVLDAPEDVDTDIEGDPEEDVPVEGESIEEQEFAAEGIPLVDIDGVDEQVEDADDELALASVGASLHVIRSNRIIASMSKAQAVKADKAEIYLDDAFAGVVCAEVQASGLRKGLTDLGFRLTTVAMTKDNAIKAEVSTKVAAARVEAANAAKQQRAALEQAFTIASVGMNRKFFKDVPNELRAAFEQELAAAGMRNGSKLVASVFAKHGISYAKALIALATKLSAMPEETRDQFVEALDLTDEDFEDAGDDQEADDEFDSEFAVDDAEVPATVGAALSRPLHSVSARASRTTPSQVSASVESVLKGDAPLPFAF